MVTRDGVREVMWVLWWLILAWSDRWFHRVTLQLWLQHALEDDNEPTTRLCRKCSLIYGRRETPRHAVL